MYLYQYFLMVGFACLFFNKNVKYPSFIFLLSWVLYVALFLDYPASYKYIVCATIETTIGCLLIYRHRLVSYLAFSLIAVNLLGLMLYEYGYKPTSYDLIYAIISVMQFVLLTIRALPNGFNRLPYQHILIRIASFDSRKTCAIIYKKPKEKSGRLC